MFQSATLPTSSNLFMQLTYNSDFVLRKYSRLAERSVVGGENREFGDPCLCNKTRETGPNVAIGSGPEAEEGVAQQVAPCSPYRYQWDKVGLSPFLA